MRRGPGNREGMALLTVLLLVAVMSAVAVTVLDDVRFSVRRTSNADTLAQAQWYADGAETLARHQITRLVASNPERTPLQPDWNGRITELPIDAGRLRAVVLDGQTCFNLNSVVGWTGDRFDVRPAAAARLSRLGEVVGVPTPRMATIVDSLIDWIDTDSLARPQGAEDGTYAGLSEPYRTSGVLLAEVSELRAIRGVDEDAYRRLRPHLCALPTDRSSININMLGPADAPLLVMLTDGQLGLADARAAIAARPLAGWADTAAFWRQPALSLVRPAPDAQDQVTVRTEFFKVRIDVEYGGTYAVRTALVEARPGRTARTLIRRWIPEE